MPGNIPEIAPTPDVAERPIGTPYNENRASPEAFGASVGQGLEQQGAVADHIATVARDRANLSAVLAARGAADNALNAQILSDDPNAGGFRSLHGHDAMTGANKAIATFDETIKNIGSSLNNEEQQRTFAHYALSLKEEAYRHVQNHLAQQSNVVDADAYKSAQLALVGKLGSLPVALDAADREKQFAEVEKSARARAYQIFGKSATPEEIQNFTVPARAKGIDQVLETLLAHGTEPGVLDVAKKLIADPQNVALLGGARAALVEGQIYRRSDAQEGLGWAQAAALANKIPGTTMISDNALEDLAKVEGRPEMKAAAERELQRLSVAGRQHQKQLNETAYTLGVAAIGNGDDDKLQKAIDTLAVPEGEGGGLLKSLLEFRATKNRRDAHDPATMRAQAEAFNAANDMLASVRASDYPSADSFLSQKMPDGRTVAESLSPSGMMRIGTEFAKKKEHEANDKPLDSHSMGLVKATLIDALQFPSVGTVALTDEQIAERNHVVDYVREKRNAWKAANPQKEPGDEQYQEWINDQVGKVPGTARHFWNSDLSRVELELQQAKAAGAAPPPVAAASPVPTPAPKAAPAPAAEPVFRGKDGKDYVLRNGKYVPAGTP